MYNKFYFLALFCFCSCKSMQGQNNAQHNTIANTNAAATPMSCNIEGQLVEIINVRDADTGSPCAKHACRARVKIISVPGCGSSVSMAMNAGDTVEMSFAYTLENTAKIFPTMPAKYPGLKRGQHFTASVEQRLKMGAEGEFVVYDYRLK